MTTSPTVSGVSILAATGTSANTDRELVASWVDGLTSAHSKRNFEATALRFLEALPVGLRAATVEDVRQALATSPPSAAPGRGASTSSGSSPCSPTPIGSATPASTPASSSR